MPSLLITVFEFPSLYVYVMASFFPGTHTQAMQFWENFGIIYNFIGSLVLEILLYLNERLNKIVITGRKENVIKIGLVILVISFIVYYYGKLFHII